MRKNFLKSVEKLTSFLDQAIAKQGLTRTSIEAGHKIVAFRSTVLTKLHLALRLQSGDHPIDKKIAELGIEEVKKLILENSPYIRFTNHPTEGQNHQAIVRKGVVVDIEANLAEVLETKKVTPKNISVLRRAAAKAGRGMLRVKSLPSVEDFEKLSNHVCQDVVSDFVENPIHHEQKMTIANEHEITIYHLDRCRWEMAKMAHKFPHLLSIDSLRLSSWGLDMDGKPHVKAGHGAQLEKKMQDQFFNSVRLKLEDVAYEQELQGMAQSRVNVALEEVSKIQKELATKVLLPDEAKIYEQKLCEILAGCEEENPDLGDSFSELKIYVGSSLCKVAPLGFTTREEIDKTDAVFAEISKIILAKNPQLAKEINQLDEEDFAKFFMQNAGNEKVAKALAQSFGELSKESQRQLMCLMESAILHEKHEHIISQFNCDKTSFIKALALFEIAKNLPQYHEEIPHLRSYYDQVSKESGFDLYTSLFANPSAASRSCVELSPLAEDRETIPLIAEVTHQIVNDPDIAAYIRAAGGVVRQTRSNSDGSASLGPQEVTMQYLEADRAVAKYVAAAGFDLEILQGIGANDLERMAPWDLDLLAGQFTAQGGDAQHQTGFRLASLLVKDVRNRSLEELEALEKKYGADSSQLAALRQHYFDLHIASEEGVDVAIGSKTTKSGFLTHRGAIPGAVVAELGKLSSRPDSRSGDVGKAFSSNETDVWHDSVYNPAMRRIGAISLQRASGISTFCLAPFFKSPEEISPELVADFNAIPSIKNINISAIFALGTADPLCFLLANGIDFEVPDTAVPGSARDYEEFLKISKESGQKAAQEFADKCGFGDPQGMRVAHLCYQLDNCRNVLRNVITPMIFNASQETKEKMEKIFTQAEEGGATQDYGDVVIGACEILCKERAIDQKTKMALACVAQQVYNVRRHGNFFDTRRELTKQAHEASQSGDLEGFKKATQQMAIITRAAGNPLSPGRKLGELVDYYQEMQPKIFTARESSRPLAGSLEESEWIRKEIDEGRKQLWKEEALRAIFAGLNVPKGLILLQEASPVQGVARGRCD